MPRLLGYAGLVPQLAVLILMAFVPVAYRTGLGEAALAYAALILSFLGALWWGLAASAPDCAPTWVWPAGVLPSLIALAVWLARMFGLLGLRHCLLALALAVAASLLVDRQLDRVGFCPRGWLGLRLQLSWGLGLLTAACALL